MNQESGIKQRILGIDFGLKKVGLAVADGSLAEPLKVIRYKTLDELIKRIGIEIGKEKIEKIIVGISEGQMANEVEKFVSAIGNQQLTIPVETFDETLSTQDAQLRSREAGIGQKKRHEMEDAYAAAIMLQDYLDSKK